MEDKKSSSSTLPVSSILVVLAVFGGLWLYKNPLMGTRPLTNTDITYEEKVPARLWQDPFAAIDKYKSENKEVRRSLQSTAIASKLTDKINKDVKVTVLGIMVFGAPYAEAAEGRLRRRYAAVSAMGRMDYVAEDSQHIDYFESKMTVGEAPDTENGNHPENSAQSGQGYRLTIPFEWFLSEEKMDNGSSNAAVLILWLNEDKFLSNPLKTLSNLISEIKKSVNKETDSKKNNLQFKILGPAGSTNLVSMMKEVTKLDSIDQETEPVFYESFEIYSPFATADRTSLFDYGLGKKNRIDNISKYLWENSGKQIKLIRTIGSDKDLCETLNNELLLRRASPADNNKNHVALIAEWDTFYGRSLPQGFKDSAFSFGLPSRFDINEFQGKYKIDKLYKKINQEYGSVLGLRKEGNTIEWLNKLLESKTLYKKTRIDINSKHLQEIKELDKTINELDKTINELDKKLIELQDEKTHEFIAKKSSAEAKQLNAVARKERCIKRRNRLFLENIYPDEIPPIATQIHRFSYLRGIDGQLPGEVESVPLIQRLEKQKDTDKNKSAEDSMRRPVGRNQFDYLLRLTQQLQDLNNELRMKDKGKIKAIGVLGSDVYDKLLILQAMRQRFPEVVFFTTDLDARLLHPDEFKWTRNLIVGSYFGFRLHKNIQGSIPPFRNNYQTSLFFSTILALNGSNKMFNDSFPQQQRINNFLQPQIFEIGRRGEFDLTVINDESESNDRILPIKLDNIEMGVEITPSLLYPMTDISKGDGYVGFIQDISILIIGGFFALFALLYVASDTTKKSVEFIRNPKNKFDHNMRIFILSFVVIVPVIFWYILYRYRYSFHLEEPFSLFDGVSIWPTEILRSVSTVLSILFIFLVWYKIRSTDRFITDTFGLHDAEKKSVKLSKLAYVFPFYWNVDDRKEKDAAACFDMIWKEYLILGPFWISALRALMYTSAFIVFTFLFMSLLEHFDFSLFVPARGEFSFLFNRIILFISVPSMLFLTFYIVGKHQLFRQFIRLSSKHEEKCILQAGGCRREDAYRKISILAEYTEQIKYLNVYSFIILFLMIIARNSYFDNWNMNFGLLTVYVTLGIFSFGCTIILHHAVKKNRDDTVDRLNKEVVALNRKMTNERKGDTANYEKAAFEIEHIQFTINAIESIHTGAFRPLHQQPLVQAALLPFGGAGSLLLINFMAK